ncbi:solute carrier family 25 member [Plakobranchus ocellatus]|uniref:Solute carrier family 25 member n=1 Tax=Plakobranchus ocellatus TaxID=259542 RepID=A0AAV4AYS6_9GAST|nr:solute carrier family 25 member [Plakobranchus ocellatus]
MHKKRKINQPQQNFWVQDKVNDTNGSHEISRCWLHETRPGSKDGFEPKPLRHKQDFVEKANKEAPAVVMSVNEYIAGALGGIAGVFVGHPFDTTKIQMQIRTSGEHDISKCSHAWANVKAQGLKNGIFRGMMFPVVSYGFVNAVFFGVYGNTIKFLEPDHSISPSNFQVYTAGCVAGSVQLLLSCPVEVVKCTMQSQIPLTVPRDTKYPSFYEGPLKPRKYYRGPIHCCRDILASEGPRGFYKGFLTMFFRDVPSYGLYLLVYEGLFKFLTHGNMLDEKGVIAAVLAGGVAGCLSWLVIMPLDVIKSRLQTSTAGFATGSVDHGERFRGFWDCAKSSVRKGGFGVLFRGTVLTIFRAFPVNGMTFLVYSQILNELNIVNPPKRQSVSYQNPKDESSL